MFLKVSLFSMIVIIFSAYVAHEYYPETIVQISSQFPILKTVGSYLHNLDITNLIMKLWTGFSSSVSSRNMNIVYDREGDEIIIRSGSSGNKKEKKHKDKLFTIEELSKFNGIDNKQIYLALMGLVFDVTKGKKHYGSGGSYAFFSGKDATRAFVTGDFNSEGFTDDIEGLSPSDYLGLEDWIKFYKSDYTYVGKLIGRYYDKNGKPTEYYHKCQKWFKQGKQHKQMEEDEKKLFPPCNVEWSQESGSRVWCTNKSGGISRDWVGVPRRLFLPGKSAKCVCITKTDDPRLREYKGCQPNAVSCVIHKDDLES